MAESQTDDRLMAEFDAPDGFAESAVKSIREKLDDHHHSAETMDMNPEGSTNEVLDIDNVRYVEIRAREFENPRVTLWLKDCPTWANDAWRETIYPRGLNAYNGKTTVVFDVRPF